MNRADLYLVLGWAFGAAKQRGDATITEKAARLLEQATEQPDHAIELSSRAEMDAATVVLATALDVPTFVDGETTFGNVEIERLIRAAQAFRTAKIGRLGRAKK